uniref:Uncharacterized protein n=1 Tax=Nyssomyia neivai TaxID=330878 RepID=A0A1L8DJ17_9DIPT
MRSNYVLGDVAPRTSGYRNDRPGSSGSTRFPRNANHPRESHAFTSWRGQEQSVRVPQKYSPKELLAILRMSPVDAFLEILDTEELFINTTVDDAKSYELTVILINLIGKLHESPLMHHLQDFIRLIFGNNTIFRDDILNYVRYAVDLEENAKPNNIHQADDVWMSLETFCSYGKNFKGTTNCWAYFTRNICRILDGKTQETLVNKYGVFLEIQKELENNYFYAETIYASAKDLEKTLEYTIPKQENGKLHDIKEYIDFQVQYLRSFFLDDLKEAVEEHRKRGSVEEDKIFIINENGTVVFPRVQIREPIKVNNNKRSYFELDLLPHLRNASELPKEVQCTLEKSKSMFMRSPLLFLSATGTFSDIIVVQAPAGANGLDTDENYKGLIYVDILRMENMNESILDKDLVLVNVLNAFESQIHSLKAFENISTATLPMRDYLIDCKASTVVPEMDELFAKTYGNEELERLEHLGLNTKQLEAFKVAHTNQFTLIQGPAGTGKSVVTMKIIESLLKNTSERIVVITYSIPSLDTFLLKCSELTDEISRIGYYSMDEKVRAMELRDTTINDPRWHRLNSKAYKEMMIAKGNFSEAMKVSKVHDSSNFIEKEFNKLRHAKSKNWEMNVLRMYLKSQHSRIIGFTTTGTAKYHQLLELLRPSIVIIEEAAILPESHLITSLTKYTKQVILVGDHFQKSHILELSFPWLPPDDTLLFDRLMKNDINNIRLNEQYRMHPEISDLMRKTYYDDLIDGENVKTFEPIRGIDGQNIFCINLSNVKDSFFHEYVNSKKSKEIKEDDESSDDDDDERTRENNSQVLYFCIGLVIYLQHQGYKPQEVVILTSDGTLDKIKPLLRKMENTFPQLNEVKLTSNYYFRGQECRIVILCLTKDLRFLTSGPHCASTLLTRAKEGLFIVENTLKFLEEKEDEPYWKKVRSVLEEKGLISSGLPVKCEKHAEKMNVSSFWQFLKLAKYCCPIGEKQPGTTPDHPCVDNIDKVELGDEE